VQKVVCALDVTETVVQEAIRAGAQLIVAHHPLIFTSIRHITTDDATGRALRAAIGQDIAIICMHTNLDVAEGGVNDALAEALGLLHIENLGAGESGTLGRVGDLPAPMEPARFAAFVKEALRAGGVRFADGGREISRVAVGGGACGKMMDFAIAKGADAFVIGDCSYDLMQRAQSLDLTLVDAGHFPTENPVVPVLARRLHAAFPEVEATVSLVHKDCIQFV
jgi:dinuclear metal center YbgI/SA1388 family protein